MTEFKQIVGRGTRVHVDSAKYYFTLIDFRKATNHFADPDFDGEPVQIYEAGENDPVLPPDTSDNEPNSDAGHATGAVKRLTTTTRPISPCPKGLRRPDPSTSSKAAPSKS